MRITTDLSAIRRTRWYEYLSRFVLGGVITAITGLIAKEFGPSIGGLFLAFPAIFPASATLIEKHEKEKVRRSAGHGACRDRQAAALDAAGASLGALGLMTFAVLTWRLISDLSPGIALSVATLGWLGISIIAWKIRKETST